MGIWRAVLIWLACAVMVQAQPLAQPPQVLIIDSERVFFETAFGQRIARDLAARTAAIQAENDAIAADLTREEQSLTRRRALLTPEAFRAEAAAFDAKVQEVRRLRDAKNGELAAEAAAARAGFEESAQAIVAAIMLDRGAAMVLEQRNVVLSVRAANITDEAIARINAELGDGAE